MAIFEDLLENTKGFPPEFYSDLREMADTLRWMSVLSKTDLGAETRYVLDHLPDLRAGRVQAMREKAKDRHSDLSKAEREQRLQTANRIERSIAQYKNPSADEQFKRRAALVELSFHLKAKIREVAYTTPELDPTRLKRFQLALSTVAGGVPGEMGGKAGREMMARMAFVQELRDAGGDVDLAVDNFYKSAFEDAERGHWGDRSLTSSGDRVVVGNEGVTVKASPSPDAGTQGPMQDWLDRQEQREHLEKVAANKVLQNMPKLAAEHLKPNEYAAYRVMIDNVHLLDWKIDASGKMRFKARALDAEDQENTIGKILQRDLHYQNIRGANLLIENTVDKLNGLLREHGKQDVVQTDKGIERMKKRTTEIVADPSAQARTPKGKGVVEI
jgi:hypothetical protein